MSVSVLDTTLRDGAQAEGIAFSLEDKRAIIRALDALGITYIEAGQPASNPKDAALFQALPPMSNAVICAFGSTRHKNTHTEEDVGLRALCESGAQTAVIFGKSDTLQVRNILKCTREENLAMISESVAFLKAHGLRVIFDAEHFFDGWRRDEDYAMQTLSAAQAAGADILTLCDTRGGTLPDDAFRITQTVCERFPGQVGVHFHNDCGVAAANTDLAVLAGATHVQGTFLGFGERCGNASLATVIPNLQLKRGYTCIPEEQMGNLYETAHRIADIANLSIPRGMPYVGRSAFAHKAGTHADAVLKQATSYEHIAPELVGNHRKVLLSEISGQSALLPKINRVAHVERNSAAARAIAKKLKELELRGYQFEAAEASFELLVRKQLGMYQSFFELVGFKTIGEQAAKNNQSASAIVHVMVDGKSEMTAAAGDGPVHAIDGALRKALEVFYPSLRAVHLIDYKVRVLDHAQATAARVRVLITSSDGAHVWSTVGVSTDIIEASLSALIDSIEYKLILDQEAKQK